MDASSWGWNYPGAPGGQPPLPPTSVNPPLPPEQPLPPLPDGSVDNNANAKKGGPVDQSGKPIQSNYAAGPTDWQQNYGNWNQNTYGMYGPPPTAAWSGYGQGPWTGAPPPSVTDPNYNAWSQYYANSGPPQGPPPTAAPVEPQPTPVEKKSTEEYDESKDPELIEFDAQFKTWEQQFEKWREENKEHPDKTALQKYEETWNKWRDELLAKREQIKKTNLEQSKTGSTKPSLQSSDASATTSKVPDNSAENQQQQGQMGWTQNSITDPNQQQQWGPWGQNQGQGWGPPGPNQGWGPSGPNQGSNYPQGGVSQGQPGWGPPPPIAGQGWGPTGPNQGQSWPPGGPSQDSGWGPKGQNQTQGWGPAGQSQGWGPSGPPPGQGWSSGAPNQGPGTGPNTPNQGYGPGGPNQGQGWGPGGPNQGQGWSSAPNQSAPEMSSSSHGTGNVPPGFNQGFDSSNPSLKSGPGGPSDGKRSAPDGSNQAQNQEQDWGSDGPNPNSSSRGKAPSDSGRGSDWGPNGNWGTSGPEWESDNRNQGNSSFGSSGPGFGQNWKGPGGPSKDLGPTQNQRTSRWGPDNFEPPNNKQGMDVSTGFGQNQGPGTSQDLGFNQRAGPNQGPPGFNQNSGLGSNQMPPGFNQSPGPNQITSRFNQSPGPNEGPPGFNQGPGPNQGPPGFNQSSRMNQRPPGFHQNAGPNQGPPPGFSQDDGPNQGSPGFSMDGPPGFNKNVGPNQGSFRFNQGPGNQPTQFNKGPGFNQGDRQNQGPGSFQGQGILGFGPNQGSRSNLAEWETDSFRSHSSGNENRWDINQPSNSGHSFGSNQSPKEGFDQDDEPERGGARNQGSGGDKRSGFGPPGGNFNSGRPDDAMNRNTGWQSNKGFGGLMGGPPSNQGFNRGPNMKGNMNDDYDSNINQGRNLDQGPPPNFNMMNQGPNQKFGSNFQQQNFPRGGQDMEPSRNRPNWSSNQGPDSNRSMPGFGLGPNGPNDKNDQIWDGPNPNMPARKQFQGSNQEGPNSRWTQNAGPGLLPLPTPDDNVSSVDAGHRGRGGSNTKVNKRGRGGGSNRGKRDEAVPEEESEEGPWDSVKNVSNFGFNQKPSKDKEGKKDTPKREGKDKDVPKKDTKQKLDTAKPQADKSKASDVKPKGEEKEKDSKDSPLSVQAQSRAIGNVLAMFRQKAQEGGSASIPGLDLPSEGNKDSKEKSKKAAPSPRQTKPAPKKQTKNQQSGGGKDGTIDVKFGEGSKLNIGPIGVDQKPNSWKPPGEWYDDEEDNDQTNSSAGGSSSDKGSKHSGKGKRSLDGGAGGPGNKMQRTNDNMGSGMNPVGGSGPGHPFGRGSGQFGGALLETPKGPFGPQIPFAGLQGAFGALQALRAPFGPRGFGNPGPRGQFSPGGILNNLGVPFGPGGPTGEQFGGNSLMGDNFNLGRGRGGGDGGGGPGRQDAGGARGRGNSSRGGGRGGRGRNRGPEPLMDIDFTGDPKFNEPPFFENSPMGRGAALIGQNNSGPPFFELGASDTDQPPPPPFNDYKSEPPDDNHLLEPVSPHVDYGHGCKKPSVSKQEANLPVSEKCYNYRHGNIDEQDRLGLQSEPETETPAHKAELLEPKPISPMSDPVAGPKVVPIDELLTIPGRFMRPPKLVIIMRGLPGAGKTTIAKMIKNREVENGGSAPRILCLDDYFMVESEKLVFDSDSGRKVKTKVMEYEYEPEFEENYRSALVKSFKKQVDEGFFPFIIIDCINSHTKHYKEITDYAKKNDFEIYIGEIETEVQTCFQRNTHGRTLIDLQKMTLAWEKPPAEYISLDLTDYIQDANIQEVKMEDCDEEKGEGDMDLEEDPGDEEEEDEEAQTFKVIKELMASKWDTDHSQEETLAKLDGFKSAKKRMGDSKPQTIEDWLQLSECFQESKAKPGKKTVRWADIEERRQQLSARNRGFVVGQTNWERMTDPTLGSSALVQIKYIEAREK